MEFSGLRIVQPSGGEVYLFSAFADDLLAVAQVPRVRRNSARALEGYQRPEVASHIAEIRRYLESPDAVLPNAIVIAFDDRAYFEKLMDAPGADFGKLIVPVPEDE